MRRHLPPASPSMYVISLWMTAVFKKPLSETRRPLVVSFSSGSPGFFGAAMDLNAVAETVLFRILHTAFQRMVTEVGSNGI